MSGYAPDFGPALGGFAASGCGNTRDANETRVAGQKDAEAVFNSQADKTINGRKVVRFGPSAIAKAKKENQAKAAAPAST